MHVKGNVGNMYDLSFFYQRSKVMAALLKLIKKCHHNISKYTLKYFHETWYAYNGKCGNDALPIYFSEVKGHVTENGKKT